MEIGFKTESGAAWSTAKIEMTGKVGRFEIPSDKLPASVELDPNVWVLMDAKLIRK